MEYYKQTSGDTVLSYGISDTVPDGAEKITKTAYNKIVKDQAATDKAAEEKRKADAEAERKKREAEAAARKAAVDDYVSKVKAGTISIDDVPEEYKAEVRSIVDPTPTNEELKVSISNAQDAINFLLENGGVS